MVPIYHSLIGKHQKVNCIICLLIRIIFFITIFILKFEKVVHNFMTKNNIIILVKISMSLKYNCQNKFKSMLNM